ncbi:MAG: 3-hydroxybutyrate dehydrogenase [Gammaproteobacteria bacterium]|nr:MAG: 3-hydroxybutyrate dehydrogenase [Gammaproteobacteria bacterium]
MLKGKVAVLTGSTSGIGLAAAHSLAKNNAHIVLHGLLDDAEGENLAADFSRTYGVDCIFDGADLRDPQAIDRFMDRVISRFGCIDILVNNAGIQYTEQIGAFPNDKWNDILAINLSAAFHTMQRAIPVMRDQNWGRIINMASVHGLVGSINKSAYCASKHGLVGLTKVAALENAGFGMTVNAICPGWVDTPLAGAQVERLAQQNGVSVNEAKKQLVGAKQPISEMVKPSDIGDFVVFLCTAGASRISGSALPIDGAWTAQ